MKWLANKSVKSEVFKNKDAEILKGKKNRNEYICSIKYNKFINKSVLKYKTKCIIYIKL